MEPKPSAVMRIAEALALNAGFTEEQWHTQNAHAWAGLYIRQAEHMLYTSRRITYEDAMKHQRAMESEFFI